MKSSKPNTKNVVYQDGQWWYAGTTDGSLRSLKAHNKKNTTRMFVSGKYIPKTNPIHVAGRYDSWEDVKFPQDSKEPTPVDPRLLKIREQDKAIYAESDNKHSLLKDGVVYVISNKAWEEWCKVGHTRQPDRRLSSYNTGCPFRDYEIHGYEFFKDRMKIEKYIHFFLKQKGIKRKNEWYKCTPEYVLEKLKGLTNEYKVSTILQDDIEVVHNETISTRHRDRSITIYESVDDRDAELTDQRGTKLSLAI